MTDKPRATAKEARAILAAEHPVSRAYGDPYQAREQRKPSNTGLEVVRLRTELRAAQALAHMLQRENEALRQSMRDHPA